MQAGGRVLPLAGRLLPCVVDDASRGEVRGAPLPEGDHLELTDKVLPQIGEEYELYPL